MATVRVPAEWTEAGTVAAMAELAGGVGMTVVGMGGAVVVVDAPVVVVVELLELLEHAEAATARLASARAAAAFFTPRVDVRTGEPPGSQGCRIESPKCAMPVPDTCRPREQHGTPTARGGPGFRVVRLQRRG